MKPTTLIIDIDKKLKVFTAFSGYDSQFDKNEEWRDVKGYEGRYQVSDLGRVKSLTHEIPVKLPSGKIYSRISKGRLLRQKTDRDNYLLVSLGSNTTRKVHRLVAESFIENPNGYPVVNHKDENKTNNHKDNLEWCTIGYNNKYGTCRERSEKAHQKGVLQIDKNDRIISSYSSLLKAEQTLGIKGASTMICRCCKGKIKQAYGFKWKYKKD